METIKIIQYSDKSIVIVGETKPIKEQLKAAFSGAIKWNAFLKAPSGDTFKGWVLSKKHEQAARELLEKLQDKNETVQSKVSAPAPIPQPQQTKPKPVISKQPQAKQPIVTPNWQLPTPPENLN